MRMILLSAIACAITFAQTPDPQIEFEVATVKPSAPAGLGPMRIGNRGGPGTPDPGRFTCDRCNLSMLVSTAYDLNYVQISGPSWLAEQQFDVTAKVPEGATKEQFRVMMQNLLIERFKLAAHHEKKEAPVYELSVAKSGAKLKASAGEADAPDPAGRGSPPPPRPGQMPRDADGFPQLPPGRRSMMMIMTGRARWRVVDETMEQFSKALQGMVGRPVNDATGLTGRYDFDLSFAPVAGGMGLMGRGPMPGPLPPPPGAGRPEGPDAGGPDDSAPSIFTAVQDQLGLRLESKKGPVDTLVIDHIEKTPTEN